MRLAPNSDELMPPAISVLKDIGGSESISKKILTVLHKGKQAGYLENTARSFWALTDKAKQAKQINICEVVMHARSLDKKRRDPVD